MSQTDIEHARRNLEHLTRRFLDAPADDPALRRLAAELELATARERKLLDELDQLRAQSLAQAPSYRDWIDSDPWRDMADDTVQRADSACQICKSTTDLEVHHNTYVRFGGRELPSDLICVCRACHTMIHLTRNLSDKLV